RAPQHRRPHALRGTRELRRRRRLRRAAHDRARHRALPHAALRRSAVRARAAAGQKVFERERCARCHTPPLYTNNKLTLADGFTPPEDSPLDIVRTSVHTDPGLALNTRKGTGFYKVPSLKGLWYRGHYLHDGSVGSLEEMFDPERVLDTHEPK